MGSPEGGKPISSGHWAPPDELSGVWMLQATEINRPLKAESSHAGQGYACYCKSATQQTGLSSSHRKPCPGLPDSLRVPASPKGCHGHQQEGGVEAAKVASCASELGGGPAFSRVCAFPCQNGKAWGKLCPGHPGQRDLTSGRADGLNIRCWVKFGIQINDE